MSQGNPMCVYILGEEFLESSPVGKDLGALVGERGVLDMSQQLVTSDKESYLQYLGLHQHRGGSRERERIVPSAPPL